LETALSNAELAVKREPDRTDSRLAYIRALLAAKRFDRAEEELRILSPVGGRADVLVQRGVLLASLNQIPDASAAFEKALAADPGSLEALAGLLALDLNARNYAAARSRVSQSLQALSPTPGLLLLAARTYGSTGDLLNAEHLLRRAIDLDPTNLGAYTLLGQIYLKQQRLEEASREFDKLAERQSSPVAALTMSGLILQALNQHEQARSRYERAVAIDPRAGVAANNLAWLHLQSGRRLDESVRLARLAVEAMPDSSQALDTLGWSYYKSGFAEVAVGPLVKSVEKDPGNAEYRFHLGMAYAKTGDKRRSRDMLLAALKGDGNASWAAEAKQTLETLGGDPAH
jgi:tetratricopeptide (TPR) repeat protein